MHNVKAELLIEYKVLIKEENSVYTGSFFSGNIRDYKLFTF